jgi:hypothetical protein
LPGTDELNQLLKHYETPGEFGDAAQASRRGAAWHSRGAAARHRANLRRRPLDDH